VSDSSASLRRLAAAAAKLFVGTLASRLLGFVRILLMARYFGGGERADAFWVAFMIPNLFRRVLGEQAVESAFLPTFRSMLNEGRTREAWRTASVVLNRLVALLAIAGALSALLAPQLVDYLVAPGFDAAEAARATRLGRVMCPFILLIGLAAFFGSLLLANRQNWAYSLAPTLFNVGFIAVMIAFRRLGAVALAYGVLVGGALQLAATGLATAWGHRREPEARCVLWAGFRDAGASQVMRLAGPVALAALISRAGELVDLAVASFLEAGSVAALRYAMPLVLLPFALFGLSVGRAALVPLSEKAGEAESFRDGLASAIHLGLSLLIPLSVGTALLAHDLSGLLATGNFGAEAQVRTALALRCYALGLAGMGFVSILARALHALRDTKSPLRTALVGLVVNAALSVTLAMTPLRHGGIALATSVGVTLQAVLLFRCVRRRIRERGAEPSFASLLRPTARIGLATAAMAAGMLAAGLGASELASGASLAAHMVRLAAGGGAGAITYAAAMFVLDAEGIRGLIRRRSTRP
jgi:putative peptidoglycan lipid II flippase